MSQQDRALRLTAMAAMAALASLVLLLWLDKVFPQAGIWALLLLSISVGFIHGALDAVLLPQRFSNRQQVIVMFGAYLGLVLILGWLLSHVISLALAILLLMSIWHFGEPYGRWNAVSTNQSLLTRAVVGGAPVMLPVWLAPEQFATALIDVVPSLGFRGWQALAWLWLVALTAWLLWFGVSRMPSLRHAWYELLGCVALNGLFSPLMAFALYFGFYHAPVHIWRVWRAYPKASFKISGTAAIAAVVGTTFLAWLLGAGLGWYLAAEVVQPLNWPAALRWLIVAFAALTAPHLVLISLCAVFLTQPSLRR